MTEVQHQPLLRASEDTVVNMRSGDGRSANKKALMVAGFTVLACLLIAGQALTAYFVLNQRSQLEDLKQTNEAVKKQLLHQPSGPSGSKMMHVPINNMPMMMMDTTDNDDSKDPFPGPKRGASDMATSSFGELNDE
ncbi:invariant chain-like protein 14-1-like [Arapaima gigas]